MFRKFSTKWGELVQLMQNFVPRSCVESFCNERTQSNPLDPKLIFWCVRIILVHLGQFGWLTKLSAKWAKLVQKFVPRSRVRILLENAPDPPHWTLNSCFGALYSVWVHLESFGNYKLGAKLGELAHLMQKFVPRSHIVIFSQRTHSIHSIGP